MNATLGAGPGRARRKESGRGEGRRLLLAVDQYCVGQEPAVDDVGPMEPGHRLEQVPHQHHLRLRRCPVRRRQPDVPVHP